ncbi:MAG: polysaccharide biosynthesis tyrosine autokinase [Bacteroidota bacterium]
MPGARYGYQNEMLILKSNKLSQDVARTLLNSFQSSSKQDTLDILKASNGAIAGLETISRRVRQNVTFRQVNEEQSVIYIYGYAYDPNEAMILANTFANTYKQNNIDQSVSQVREAKNYLRTKMRETNDSLIATEKNILEFYRQKGFSESGFSTESIIDQISILYQELDQARIQLAANKEEIAAIDSTLQASRANETQIILDATDNLIEYYEERIIELELQKQEVLAKVNFSGSDSSKIGVIDNKLTNYKGQLKQALDKKLDNTTLLSSVDGSFAKYWIELKARKSNLINQNRALPEKIQKIQEQITQYDQQLNDIPYQEMELEKLQRRRNLYANSIQKFQTNLIEMELAEASEGGYVNILDPAKPNPNPINKQKTTGVFQGTLIGMLLGIGLIIGYERIDDRIKSDEDIKELDANVIASIPSMESALPNSKNRKNFVDYKGAFISSKLITLLNPMSGISEMYRRLRANFTYSVPDKSNKSFLITSSNPQEGKSVTASNLAVVLAQSGKRVALLDGDLRRPNLDVIFGLPKSPGISDLIVGQEEYDDILKQSIIENLYVLTAGSQVPNPSEILGSESFKKLFDTVLSEFDYVIVDSPPVNSVVDAVTIGDLVDQYMLVINVGKTKKREVKQTFELAKSIQSKFAGVLLNNLDNNSYLVDYNYYQNYNYYGNGVTVEERQRNPLKSTIDVS